MCECCLAETEDYGEVLPGYRLVRATCNGQLMKANDWGLVYCYDPDFIFTTTPIDTPLRGMSDEEMLALKEDDERWEADNCFIDVAQAVSKEMLQSLERTLANEIYLDVYGQLWDAMKKAGYRTSEDGIGIYWLVAHIAQFIATNPEPMKMM